MPLFFAIVAVGAVRWGGLAEVAEDLGCATSGRVGVRQHRVEAFTVDSSKFLVTRGELGTAPLEGRRDLTQAETVVARFDHAEAFEVAK